MTRIASVGRIALPALVLALAMVVGVTPGGGRVYATDVFGALRAPGEPAFVAAHRGDRSTAPENTMPAFEAAFADPTLAYVETDVQLTADGVPVLFHDVSLRRITGSKKSVSDLTFAQLHRLDAGAWYGSRFAGVRVPTLQRFLDRLRESDKSAIVELKFAWTAEQVQKVIGLIEQRSLGARVVLATFSIETLQSIQRVAPQAPRIMLARELSADPVPVATQLGVLAIATTARAVLAAPEGLRRMHEASLGVLCYTLNSEETWGEAMALGVDGIITDVPSELDAWLASSARGT